MRACDLFAGCGGLSKGFELAGFEIILGVENWDAAQRVYRDNFRHPIRDLDLSDVNRAVSILRRQRPEIIVGGPPCQDFSAAGSRKEGGRAQLTINFAKIIRAIEPQWFVFENVPGAQKSMAWAKASRLLERAGYGITECVMNAAYYGVPQFRKRFFAIGCMGAEPGFLIDQLDYGRAENPMSVREFVGDEFGIDFYYRHPRHWGRRAIFSIDEPSPTVRSTNRPVAPGYKRHPEDAECFTRVRPLTVRERSRIQTFDRGFSLTGSATELDTMIANAVPVQLAEHVASAIVRYREEASMKEDPNFRSWLANEHDYTARTTGNVISRLKRAAYILNVERVPLDASIAIDALERRNKFKSLSVSVRSQLRKAIRLHAEYHGT